VARWLLHYRREWLGPDLVAGLIVWSVVVPQAVAYAQIAGLPPSAGLVAARPVRCSGTRFWGPRGRSSWAQRRPLADGDPVRYAALSAALALLAAAVFIGAGLLRLGGVMDLVSKPVLTGFLFGLGLTVAIGQLPNLIGVEAGTGTFFEKLWALLGELDQTQWWTLAVGAASIALLIAFRRLAPGPPGTLIVLALAIVASALLDLSSRGVDVVGELPSAVPDPT
jgi:sulfate permease, SulP family